MVYRIWHRIFLFLRKYVKVIKGKVSCHEMCSLLSSDSEKNKEKIENKGSKYGKMFKK